MKLVKIKKKKTKNILKKLQINFWIRSQAVIIQDLLIKMVTVRAMGSRHIRMDAYFRGNGQMMSLKALESCSN